MLFLSTFTARMDLPLILVIFFLIFFLCLVYYLHGEDKREGYPLESDRSEWSGGRVQVVGWPGLPSPKTFLLPTGEKVTVPRTGPEPELKAVPAFDFPGAPLVPTGDGLADGVGPAAYTLAKDEPDKTSANELKFAPLRDLPDYEVEESDESMIGHPVLSIDGQEVGRVVDLWIDRTEYYGEFYEVERDAAFGGHRVLAPIALTSIVHHNHCVGLDTLTADQFRNAPRTASPNQVTRREEHRIQAYYGAGEFYTRFGKEMAW